MLANVSSGSVEGLDPLVVRVEVHLSSGLPTFTVVGLAHGAVREGRERVTAALRNAGFRLPHRRITVNLAPADVRKGGAAFDLPIAMGILAAGGELELPAAHAFLGELGLDGSLRPVPGVLPMASKLGEVGVHTLILPVENAREASLVPSLEVLGAPSLARVVDHLSGRHALSVTKTAIDPLLQPHEAKAHDLRDVQGQGLAKRALEIAAAGAHNLLLVGPPGAGKTMLALRMPGILPPLTAGEALECTRIHSVAGHLVGGGGLVTGRPFRAPHHSVSEAGMVGGGAPLRPGEMSLAHNGVLFLDELPEYRRNAIEALRQPLEEGGIRMSRAGGAFVLPARFTLVAAMNPCPCGHFGDGSDRCLCDPGRVRRYRGRVSGPVLDRIDMHLYVPSVPFARVTSPTKEESSRVVRDRVAAAREIQRDRFLSTPGVTANGHMPAAELARRCRISPEVALLLERAARRARLSARACHRILKVARTIADLAGSRDIEPGHAAEAVQYRALDHPVE